MNKKIHIKKYPVFISLFYLIQKLPGDNKNRTWHPTNMTCLYGPTISKLFKIRGDAWDYWNNFRISSGPFLYFHQPDSLSIRAAGTHIRISTKNYSKLQRISSTQNIKRPMSTWKYGNDVARLMGATEEGGGGRIARGGWHPFMAMQRQAVWFQKGDGSFLFSGLFRCPLCFHCWFLNLTSEVIVL